MLFCLQSGFLIGHRFSLLTNQKVGDKISLLAYAYH